MRMITPRDQRPGCVLRIVATRATVNFSDGSDGIFLIVSGDCDKSVNFQHRSAPATRSFYPKPADAYLREQFSTYGVPT